MIFQSCHWRLMPTDFLFEFAFAFLPIIQIPITVASYHISFRRWYICPDRCIKEISVLIFCYTFVHFKIEQMEAVALLTWNQNLVSIREQRDIIDGIIYNTPDLPNRICTLSKRIQPNTSIRMTWIYYRLDRVTVHSFHSLPALNG